MISFRHKYFIAQNLVKLCPRRDIGPRVLMYHSTPEFADKSDHYSVDLKQLMNQINTLESNGLHFSSLKDVNQNSVAITFDDGFKNNLLFAAPFLVEKKIPFTVFVVSDFVSKEMPGYLNKEELFKLSGLPGVTIGAHGKTHTPLATLSFRDACEEIIKSKKDIEEIIQKEVDMMSFPHGSYTTELVQIAQKSGIKKVATSCMISSKDEIKISRLPIFSYDKEKDVLNKVYGKWDLIGAFL